MKQVLKKLLKVGEKSFELPMLEFESLAEAHASSGSEANTLAKLNAWCHAHQTFGDAREILDEVTFEITKVPYLTIPVLKDGKPAFAEDGKTPLLERDWAKDSEANYIKRALALKPDAFDAIQKEAARRAGGYTLPDNTTVEPLATSLKVRAPGQGAKPKKLPAKFADYARAFLTGKQDLAKFQKTLKNMEIAAFEFVKDVPKDDEQNVQKLGWICKAYFEKWEEQQMANAFKS